MMTYIPTGWKLNANPSVDVFVRTPSRTPTSKLSPVRPKFACYMWEGHRRHTGPELHTGGVRGSKPARFGGTG